MNYLETAGYSPVNERWLPDESTIYRRAAEFHSLVARAETKLAAGRLQDAAALAQVAATYAMNQHTGMFASTRLERLLTSIGTQAAGSSRGWAARPPYAGAPEHILHVMSLSWSIGGHSRMVWRWINADPGRRHSVAVTHQAVRPVPEQLIEAATGTGGAVHVLDRHRGDLLSWARQLRSLAQRADLVVLHTNPDDVIPNLAFAVPEGMPPVVLLNHADHVFWLGASICSVVANQRRSGMELAINRRGIEHRRNAMLPIVIDPPRRTIDRLAARWRLGLPEDALVLLSIARGHKFEPLESPWEAANRLSFPDCIVPALARHPEAVLVIVGPEPDDRWMRASDATHGRIHALGPRDPVDAYYAAADIYLDSFPVTSITSLLEAAGYGLPLVTSAPFPPGCEVFASDTPGLDHCVLTVRSADELTATLDALILDPAVRTSHGEAARSSVAAVHTDPGWRHYLDTLYRQVAGAAGERNVPSFDPSPLVDDVDLLLGRMFRSGPDIDETLVHNLGNMSNRHRLQTWRSLRNRDVNVSPGLLLPGWLALALERRRLSLDAGISRVISPRARQRAESPAHGTEIGAPA